MKWAASVLEGELWFAQNECVVKNAGCCFCWSVCSAYVGVMEVQLWMMIWKRMSGVSSSLPSS